MSSIVIRLQSNLGTKKFANVSTQNALVDFHKMVVDELKIKNPRDLYFANKAEIANPSDPAILRLDRTIASYGFKNGEIIYIIGKLVEEKVATSAINSEGICLVAGTYHRVEGIEVVAATASSVTSPFASPSATNTTTIAGTAPTVCTAGNIPTGNVTASITTASGIVAGGSTAAPKVTATLPAPVANPTIFDSRVPAHPNSNSNSNSNSNNSNNKNNSNANSNSNSNSNSNINSSSNIGGPILRTGNSSINSSSNIGNVPPQASATNNRNTNTSSNINNNTSSSSNNNSRPPQPVYNNSKPLDVRPPTPEASPDSPSPRSRMPTREQLKALGLTDREIDEQSRLWASFGITDEPAPAPAPRVNNNAPITTTGRPIQRPAVEDAGDDGFSTPGGTIYSHGVAINRPARAAVNVSAQRNQDFRRVPPPAVNTEVDGFVTADGTYIPPAKPAVSERLVGRRDSSPDSSPRPSAPPAPKQECPACTFLNWAGSRNCDVCEGPL